MYATEASYSMRQVHKDCCNTLRIPKEQVGAVKDLLTNADTLLLSMRQLIDSYISL
jgi:hypothetical protein